MGLISKVKQWALNAEFNTAVENVNNTPTKVLSQLREKGYEIRVETGAIVAPYGGMAMWTTVLADKFNGQAIPGNPELRKQFEQDRVQLVCAHFGKPYPPAPEA